MNRIRRRNFQPRIARIRDSVKSFGDYMVRVFFSTDIHGSTALMSKLIRVPMSYKVDVLMVCGDLTGKVLVPLIENQDGTYESHYLEGKTILKTQNEIEAYEKRVSSTGAYPISCTWNQVEEFQGNQRKVHETMLKAILARMNQWMELLVAKIDTKTIKTIVMPGNDDSFEVDSVIQIYKNDGIIYPLDKVIDIGGFEMVSLDYVNFTPWDTPRETSEKNLAKKIEKLVNMVSVPNKAIFNFHPPPYNTRLDLAPKLTKDLKVVTIMGRPMMIHVGSKVVKAAIKEYQPLIGLHGHIHESFADQRIDNTPVLNPGSEYESSLLRGFIIELTTEGVEKYWKVEG